MALLVQPQAGVVQTVSVTMVTSKPRSFTKAALVAIAGTGGEVARRVSRAQAPKPRSAACEALAEISRQIARQVVVATGLVQAQAKC